MSESSPANPDPWVHRQREQQLIQHVERLLQDERLRIDTTLGRRPITAFTRDVSRGDKSIELKRLMSELNVPDRELQNRMPIGEALEVTLWQRKMWVLRSNVGRLRVVSFSPVRALLKGEEPKPMSGSEVSKALAQLPPPLGKVPDTIVLLSTSGFSREAHELADRRSDRTVILVEPNEAGGWSVTGPVETKALADLFDPEGEDQKRQRVRELIGQSRLELLSGGLASDRLAGRAQLPVQVVEAELKTYARDNPGLSAKRLDGRVVLFREGTTAPPSPAAGVAMPLIDRVKTLFSRKGDSEKKISFLSERRAALCVQRDRAFEEVGLLEQQEVSLKEQFRQAISSSGKRRITSQLLQLRKDLERRQQLLSVLNQQVNVVSTHLHNLELVQQGKVASLPNTEEMTADAVKAEEVLAELEANTELAGTVGSVASGGMTAEEQSLMEELERETSGATAAQTSPAAEPAAASSVSQPAASTAEPAAPQAAVAPSHSEPEPG